MGETLSKPVTEKHTSTYETKLLRVGCCGMQGWRKKMEDSHAVLLSLGGNSKHAAFGVYDGHNGHNVAKYCGTHMVETLLEQPEYEKKNYGKAWEDAYVGIDETLSKHPEHAEGGCAAISALVADGRIICANAGDSRAILCRADGTVVPLSEDHKPTLPREIERIAKAGGKVEQGRVNGLSLTRAIGDFSYRDRTLPPKHQAITCFPDITETKMQPTKDKYLILACDGIWDVVTNEECAKFVADKMKETKNDVGLTCEALCDRCCATEAPGNGTDNMTVIIVEFKDEYWQ